jgi:hypothetical protein
VTGQALGGPFDAEFAADTPEEIGKKSQEANAKRRRRTFSLQAA